MKLHVPPGIRAHLGKITGVLFGILFGLRLFGALFGLLVGALADIFLRELRLRKSLRDTAGADAFFENQSPQLRFVLLISRLALRAFLIEAGTPPADEARDRLKHGRVAAGQEEGSQKKEPPENHRPSGGIDTHDLAFLEELALQSLSLSPRGKSAVRQFFKAYRENPSVLPDEEALNYPEGFDLKASEQIAVSRLLFSAAQIGGKGPGISGTAYRFIIEQCSRLGIENRYRDIAAHILKVRDTTSYEILGVSPDTPPGEIRRIYRTLAAQFHPDSLHGLSREQQEAAAEAFLRIKRAYERIFSE
jgi:hypothetical protein